MKKYVAIFLCLAAAVVLGLVCFRPQQPQYAGKPLGYWLQELDRWPRKTNEAEKAILAIGTNAIPLYLRMLQAKGTPLTTWILFRGGASLVDHRMVRGSGSVFKDEFARLVGFEVLQPLGRRDANSLRYDALQAFFVLREIGAPAAAGLSNLLFASDGYQWPANDPIFTNVRSPEFLSWLRQSDAAGCLAFIGPSGRAALLQGSQSPNDGIRAAAVHGLGLCRPPDSVVVRALAGLLDDANSSVRTSAAWSLYHVARELGQGTNAASVQAISPMVTPLLRRLSNTNVYHLRRYAALALGECHAAEALPFIQNMATNSSPDNSILDDPMNQVLKDISERPVHYGAQLPRAPAKP